MMREELFQNVIKSLEENAYQVTTFFTTNSCFDIIARQQNTILIIKVLNNIDSLRAEHAIELKKLAQAFHAHPLLIGEKSKVFSLRDEVVYERQNIPALSLNAFQFLLSGKLPFEKSFKGKSAVVLDYKKLREIRFEKELTLEKLSQITGISLESLHRYEHGSPAQLEVAQKLEKILHAPLIVGINVFEAFKNEPIQEDQPLPNETLEKLRDLGLKMNIFEHAPLTAAGMEHRLLISESSSKKNLQKKANLLWKTQRIVQQPGLIISHKKSAVHINEVPVLHADEISTFSTIEDMLSTIMRKRNDSYEKR